MTICPVRLEDAEAAAVVAYVLAVAEREPMSGAFIGMREWPVGGGLAEQPASVVEAVFTVLGELGLIQKAATAPEDAKGSDKGTDGPPRP